MNTEAFIKDEFLLCWNKITQLSEEKSEYYFQIFLDKFVKKDFQKKIKKNINSYKPITQRFFKSAIITNVDKLLCKNETNAIVIKFSKKIIGYKLQGTNMCIDDLFIDTSDSIAFIDSNNNNVDCFFYTSHLEVVYKLKE